MLSASALVTSDTMLDSGANHIFFPSYHSHYMSQFKPNNNNDRVTVANGQTLAITGSAFLGPFHILIAPGLHKPLISESYLTTRFDILIVRYDESTWLIDAFKARTHRKTDPTDYVIARANIEDDGLYYITNILDLAYANPKPRQRVRFPTANHVSTGGTFYFVTERVRDGIQWNAAAREPVPAEGGAVPIPEVATENETTTQGQEVTKTKTRSGSEGEEG